MIDYYPNKYNDTIVVLCYFCAKRYRTKISNLYNVINSLKKANIPYYLIELLFKNQCNVFDANKTVKSNSYMFYKENLYNISEKNICENYKKIVFLDADIWFTDPDWFNKCSELLNVHQLVQPMEYCVWNENTTCRRMISYAANLLSENKQEKSHPGFALGITRDFLKNIGGFYDKAFIGGGDRIFWESLFPSYLEENIDKKISFYHELSNYLDKKDKPSVGYIKECEAVHMPHGSTKDRKYKTRFESYLKTSIKSEDFYKNEYEVYEWKDEQNSKLVLDYFLSRDEDRYLEIPLDFDWEFYITCNKGKLPEKVDNKETAIQHYVDYGRLWSLPYKKL